MELPSNSADIDFLGFGNYYFFGSLFRNFIRPISTIPSTDAINLKSAPFFH